MGENNDSEINTSTIDKHIRESKEKGTFDFFNQNMDYIRPYLDEDIEFKVGNVKIISFSDKPVVEEVIEESNDEDAEDVEESTSDDVEESTDSLPLSKEIESELESKSIQNELLETLTPEIVNPETTSNDICLLYTSPSPRD